MFKALDLNALSKEDPRFLLDSFTSRMGRGEPVPPEHFVNDLEPPAFQCIPDLKKIKDRLLVRACGYTWMCGSVCECVYVCAIGIFPWPKNT